MRRLLLFFAIMICMIFAASLCQADQLKTGIMKSAPSPIQAPKQITRTPTPQAPAVKTAPGVTAPVPTKQGLTAPLGQKATIAVKSPTQGTRHPADKPLAIVWDRSAIPAAATVNIILVDKPGGTAKATIKAGAYNTGSFTSWIAPQQYTAAGNSWAIRIETADSKASGHSGVFSFQAATSVPFTTKAIVPSLTPERKEPAHYTSIPTPSAGQANQMRLLEELKLGQRKDFSRTSLAGLSLNNLNLEQVIFSGADLSGVDFSEADLTNCDFTGANLTGANLTKANCRAVSFKNARLNKATLKQTLLSGANFNGATLDGAIFDMVVVSSGSIPIIISNAQSVIFKNCTFKSHNFKNINMKNMTIIGGQFYRTEFTGSNLDNLSIFNNPSFIDAKIPVKYIEQFKGKTDSFPYIKWVN